MTDFASVEIVLNLLEYQERLKTPDDYLLFWNKVSVGLLGQPLAIGKTHSLESSQGKVGLTIISVPVGFSVVTQNTRFAIHSVLEPPDLRYKCSVCQSYGPFRCVEKNCENRICEKHAIILDGSMRAYCPTHAPICKGSGKNATFWCDGPRCHSRVAWSDQYRIQHPNDIDHWFCPDCYKIQFPSCSIPSCTLTGTTRCEYIDKISGKSCDHSLCNKHAKLWQIYGPHKLGVVLCSEHTNIKQLSEAEILYQMVAITARRVTIRRSNRRRQNQDFIDLPSLMSMRHIYINAKNQLIAPSELDKRLELLKNGLQASGNQSSQEMGILIEKNKQKRNRELQTFASDQQQGQDIFYKLQEKLRLQGEDILVSNLRFADYRPNKKILFVYLDSQYRGRLVGKEGAKIKPLQEYLGVRIQFEDK
jgi:hypothetical protein